MASSQKPVFTTGSTMRHVVVMTATSSIGLVAIFLVDVINLFYISLLGQQELAAAIGYASTIMFFSISVGIGMSIAAAAIVAKSLGAGNESKAGCEASSALVYVGIVSTCFAIFLYSTLDLWLNLLGAEGKTLTMARQFMQIVVPSIPLLGLGMCLGALLRSKGDPRRAMFVTLSGGAAALVLDPILIFGLDLGLNGAAIATVLVRVILVGIGLYCVQRIHQMLRPIGINHIKIHASAFFTIAAPAVATQLATPVGNAYITSAIATFGDDAVAGWAIVGRIIPVAFGVMFALSGSVGPILSQNLGAKLFPRVRQTLKDALLFTLIYCLIVWGVLALSSSTIISVFDAKGDAAYLIELFCWFVSASFLFNGALFVANAAFNNLGHPFYATMFNWGRATLGVVPFVYVGQAYGVGGVLIGWGLGAIVFGVGSVIVSLNIVRKLDHNHPTDEGDGIQSIPPSANSPFTSGKAIGFGFTGDPAGGSDEKRRDD